LDPNTPDHSGVFPVRTMKEKNNTNILTNTLVVCLLAAFCNALWGSAFPSVKKGYELLAIDSSNTATQILFAGCRFFLAGVLVILFRSVTKKKLVLPKKEEMGSILKIGMIQTVLQYFFFYVGMAHTSGAKGSIINSVSVFFNILVTCLIFRMEKLSSKKILGCVLGFAGVVLVTLDGSAMELSLNLLGDGFVTCSALTNAFVSVMIKKFSQKVDPVVLNGYQFFFGGAIMMLGGYAAGGRIGSFNLPGLGMLLYLAFLSATAYTIWSVLLKYNPISKVTIFGFTKPIFGVILSALMLQESGAFGIKGLVALALVCVGIIVVNRDKKDAPRLN